ncbi:MAG: cation diffusion facilitator family transporter [Clostridia bacterium]|nr:cation diffusion facilitator family transporter [Clostridia bacterium]
MKSEKNILAAFILNLFFSIFEFAGGIFSGSVAIMSDAVHDLGDAASIGLSYFLERKAKKQPDSRYTYGYARYSVLGGVIATVILIVGSVFVVTNAIRKIFNPAEINYNGMIIFAVIGVIVNFLAAYFTHGGESVNQRAVNLHMLEDVLGWVVVLVGAVIMRFTNLALIDPIMSIAVAVFIFINAVKNLKTVLDIFLEKAPDNIDIAEIIHHTKEIDGVLDVHHIHLRSIDEHNVYATMHIKAAGDFADIKHKIKDELKAHGIAHSTLEFENENEDCGDKECHIHLHNHSGCGHHHH